MRDASTSLIAPQALEIDSSLDEVLRIFDEELRSDQPFINDLTERVRRYRGKLLRPRLLLMAGRAAGEIKREHLTLAAVVEMVHMATLVHDDVLDDAAARRSSPTINRLVGNEAAVMLGDFLISHAYHLCSSVSSEAARRIAAVTNTVCEGELLQIHHRGNLELDEAAYFEIIRRKTAALTGVCCELGARYACADSEVIEGLCSYGIDLGIAFQIVDDLLDLLGDEDVTGKTTGRDAAMGKMTLPMIRFLEQSTPAARSRFGELFSTNKCENASELRRMLGASDAVEYTRMTASSYIQSAISRLSCVADSDAKSSLIAAAEFVLARQS